MLSVSLVVAIVFFLIWQRIVLRGLLKTVVFEPKWVNQAQFAGIFVAKERGYFQMNGLNVVIKEFGFETNTVKDVADGKVDMVLTTPEALLKAVDGGADLVAVASYFQSSPMLIVTLRDSGISSPADFKGKLLGNKGGNIEEELLYALLLNSVGLSTSEAKIVNVGFETRETDDLRLRTVNVIDLYRTDELYFFNRDKIAYKLIYPEQFGINTFSDILVVRRDYLNKNQKTIKAFIKASIQGWEKALSDYNLAVGDTLKNVTDANYKDFDHQMFIIKQSAPLIRPSPAQSIGAMEADRWSNLYLQMHKAGLVTRNINVDEIFTNSLLP